MIRINFHCLLTGWIWFTVAGNKTARIFRKMLFRALICTVRSCAPMWVGQEQPSALHLTAKPTHVFLFRRELLVLLKQ
jgi:hypothetical protein